MHYAAGMSSPVGSKGRSRAPVCATKPEPRATEAAPKEAEPPTEKWAPRPEDRRVWKELGRMKVQLPSDRELNRLLWAIERQRKRDTKK